MTASLPDIFHRLQWAYNDALARKWCLNYHEEPHKAVNPRSFTEIETFPRQSYLIAGQAVIFSRA